MKFDLVLRISYTGFDFSFWVYVCISIESVDLFRFLDAPRSGSVVFMRNASHLICVNLQKEFYNLMLLIVSVRYDIIASL